MNNFVFNLGDQLQYTASSAQGERTIIDAPSGNQTYTFQYGSRYMPCPGMPTVTDIDGNAYNTVLIGNQCWMKENLKTTTYRNGTVIPNVTDASAWLNLTTGAYVWYENDISWKDRYGALYNWHTTVDVNSLCPSGWHVPTNDEWTALTDYIGGTGSPSWQCVEILQASEFTTWWRIAIQQSTHGGIHYTLVNWGTDDYGFSGLPGGYRGYNGPFYGIGVGGDWWSCTENLSDMPFAATLNYGYGFM